MDESSHNVILPAEIDIENNQCALFEISGNVFPNVQYPLYLCADFIEESIIGQKMMPILRTLSPTTNQNEEDSAGEADIDHMYPELLWLSCNRTPLKEFRVYIVDGLGRKPPFKHMQLKCTLVFQPKIYS